MNSTLVTEKEIRSETDPKKSLVRGRLKSSGCNLR